MKDQRAQAGFTLLEVLIAVAIMAVSLSSLLTSQVEAMRAGRYAQQVSVAAMLAEYQLVEIEFQMRRQGWQSNDVEFEGDFSEQGWPEIEYACLVDFIELPDYSQLQEAKSVADHATDGDQAYIQDSGDKAFAAMGIAWPIVKGAIEGAIRKSKCKVKWKDGRRPEEVEVVTFWTDPMKLDMIPGVGGANKFEDTSGDGDSTNGPAGGAAGSAPGRPTINGAGGGGLGK